MVKRYVHSVGPRMQKFKSLLSMWFRFLFIILLARTFHYP